MLQIYAATIMTIPSDRPEHFARPTSGTSDFYPRTCQLEAHQVRRT